MENKVIAKEYIDKNYIHKDVIRNLKKRIQKIYDDSPVDEFGIHNCQDTGWIEDMLDEILEENR